MVYSKKCSNCGKLLDFGGSKSKFEEDELPSNAIEFDDSLYCKECINELVQFGTEDVDKRISELNEKLEEMARILSVDLSALE